MDYCLPGNSTDLQNTQPIGTSDSVCGRRGNNDLSGYLRFQSPKGRTGISCNFDVYGLLLQRIHQPFLPVQLLRLDTLDQLGMFGKYAGKGGCDPLERRKLLGSEDAQKAVEVIASTKGGVRSD